MKRLARLATFVAAGACALVVGTSSLAVAAPLATPKSDCPSSYTCAWDSINFGGEYVAFQQGITRFSAFGFNDRATSLWNHGVSDDAVFYVNDYYSGGAYYVNRGAEVTGLGATWNNKFSSGRFYQP